MIEIRKRNCKEKEKAAKHTKSQLKKEKS